MTRGGSVRVRLLGPLEVHVGETALRLGQSRQQRLLAVLSLNANRSVPIDRIVTAVWDDDPPRTARKLIQNSVSALRQQLVEAGGSAAPVVSAAGGYTIRLGAGQLDLHLFEDRVSAAHRLASAGDVSGAVEQLRAGLALWQGPALAGVCGRMIEVHAARLEESRLAALEECLDHELALGRQHRLIGELTELVARHPLRERLAGQLMLALHRSGRRSEALAAFGRLRAHLAEELGLDPGAEVSRLHEAILRADPTLEHADRPGGGTGDAAVPRPRASGMIPAQLPADVRFFTGRTDELSLLDALLATECDRPNPAVIAAIVGTAGVGKTALALHWAHRVADRFPDGQLYVNLRGFDPSGSTTTAAEALRGFLEGLGMTPQRIPAGLPAQSALYRSLLAGRRVLVVLDNARDADHVRPLLPGAPGCVAVVTSRNRLTGLVAAEGAHPVPLDLLTAGEARALLTRRLGSDRVAAEPGATEEIISRCARLPLALSIVAARAVTQPRFRLDVLANELRATGTGLDAFSGEDAATDARAAFSWSYHALGPDAARLFRLLGLTAGPDIAVPAAASLAGLPRGRTAALLAELARSNLATEASPGRYALHDLLRAYAGELARAEDDDEQRRTALHRVYDHYLQSSFTAARLLDPHRDPITPATPVPGVEPEDLADPEHAMSWFAAEQPLLLAAVPAATDAGLDAHAWQLAWSLAVYLYRRGSWPELAATNRAAVAAAARLGDRLGQAHAHRGLGVAATQLGQLDDAHLQHCHALRLFGEAGDRSGQARVHQNLAFVADRLGRPAEALDHARQSLALYRLAGLRSRQAAALNDVGWYLAVLGEYRAALPSCEQALALHQASGDRNGEAHTWDSLGYIHHHLGHRVLALDCTRRAIASFREQGDRYNEAMSLARLGDAHYAVGDADEARQSWRAALQVLDELGDPGADRLRAQVDRLDRPDTDPAPDA